MSTIALWLSKAWIALALVAVGLVSAVPVQAYALGPSDAATPPAPTYDRLKNAWTREQKVAGRMGRLFDNVDEHLTKAQELIDKAKANGKDVTGLQAALDAFSAAVKQAQPVYESTTGIVSAHAGFDANGNVVDPVKAFATVFELHSKFSQVRQLVLPAGKALRDAIRAFRQANPPAVTPTPTA